MPNSRGCTRCLTTSNVTRLDPLALCERHVSIQSGCGVELSQWSWTREGGREVFIRQEIGREIVAHAGTGAARQERKQRDQREARTAMGKARAAM